MRTALVLIALCVSQFANAGYFVQKSLYSMTDFAVGKGKNLKEATADANAAIQKGYVADAKVNSPAYQCTDGNVWNEKTECGTAMVQYTVPVRKAAP